MNNEQNKKTKHKRAKLQRGKTTPPIINIVFVNKEQQQQLQPTKTKNKKKTKQFFTKQWENKKKKKKDLWKKYKAFV